MKKVKISETEIDDLTIEQFKFEFTEEEKEKILKEFEKWNPSFKDLLGYEPSEENLTAFQEQCLQIHKDLLDDFIFNLEMYADFFMQWIKDSPRVPNHIENTKDLIKNLRVTRGYLKNLRNMKTFVPRITTVGNMFEEKFRTDWIVSMYSAKKTVELAREAEKPIEHLLKILEYNLTCLMEIPRKTGKPSADMNSGLVDRIAELLLTSLHVIPTGYSGEGRGNRGGGLFFRLVKTVFEILEIECEDPSRLIKSSLKKLS